MATKDINKTQSTEQLRGQLAELRGKLAQLRQELIGKRLSNTSQIKQVRREIARTLTALRQNQ